MFELRTADVTEGNQQETAEKYPDSRMPMFDHSFGLDNFTVSPVDIDSVKEFATSRLIVR